MKNQYYTLTQAKELRKNMTTQEIKLWKILRNNSFCGFKFRRQMPIGNYVVDFACEQKNLIIEIDGGQHNEEENIEYDKIRTMFLESKGYQILRFWNYEVDNEIEKVKEVIYSKLYPHPHS